MELKVSNRDFQEELKNSSSPEFKELASDFEKEVSGTNDDVNEAPSFPTYFEPQTSNGRF